MADLRCKDHSGRPGGVMADGARAVRPAKPSGARVAGGGGEAGAAGRRR